MACTNGVTAVLCFFIFLRLTIEIGGALGVRRLAFALLGNFGVDSECPRRYTTMGVEHILSISSGDEISLNDPTTSCSSSSVYVNCRNQFNIIYVKKVFALRYLRNPFSPNAVLKHRRHLVVQLWSPGFPREYWVSFAHKLGHIAESSL